MFALRGLCKACSVNYIGQLEREKKVKCMILVDIFHLMDDNKKIRHCSQDREGKTSISYIEQSNLSK